MALFHMKALYYDSENAFTFQVIPLIPMNNTEPVEPSAPPPPSYEDVMSSGIYPPPSAPSQGTVSGVSVRHSLSYVSCAVATGVC